MAAQGGPPAPGGDFGDDAAPQGLSWSWGMDFEALLAALEGPLPWKRPARDSGGTAGQPADSLPAECARAGQPRHEADEKELAAGDQAAAGDAGASELESTEEVFAGRGREVPLSVVAGRVAEALPAGPDLAGWLATSSAVDLEDGALAGVAASFRRLASWAQAGELAVVAELASRSAAADGKIGVDEHGRPARIPEEACSQVALALSMSQFGASWWTDLGVTLAWRLEATGAALRTGEIDLTRARLIAEATSLLGDDTARVVEARVLPPAGYQTTGQLRAALRRAVIAADPAGADRRREEAERRAKICLYPDEEGTASLSGYSLPGIRAAAAMARITALARTLKSAGAGGGIDLLRAQVFLGLLLGTLGDVQPAGEGESGPGDSGGPDEGGGPGGGGGSGGRDSGSCSSAGPGRNEPRNSPMPGSGSRGRDPDTDDEDDLLPSTRPAWPDVPAFLHPAPALGSLAPQPGGLLDLAIPWSALAGLSEQPGQLTRLGAITPVQARQLAVLAAGNRAVQWRLILTSPAGQALAVARVRGPFIRTGPVRAPGAGSTRVTGAGPRRATHAEPARAGPGRSESPRAGPAAPDPRSIGCADSRRQTGSAQNPEPATAAGPISRVTVIIATDVLDELPPSAAGSALAPAGSAPAAAGSVPAPAGPAPAAAGSVPAPVGPGPAASDSVATADTATTTSAGASLAAVAPSSAAARLVAIRLLRAAAAAAVRAREQAVANAGSTGGCAHVAATPAYRPPPRLKEHVTARDVTCRFPTCRQPAWRCDLDHTIPWEAGGRTCSCNLGGQCRSHHQLKQHPRWQLDQPEPGTFQWTTPAGRTYTSQPDRHLV